MVDAEVRGLPLDYVQVDHFAFLALALLTVNRCKIAQLQVNVNVLEFSIDSWFMVISRVTYHGEGVWVVLAQMTHEVIDVCCVRLERLIDLT